MDKDRIIEELKEEIRSLKHALAERSKIQARKSTIDFERIKNALDENAGRVVRAVVPPAKKATVNMSRKIAKKPLRSAFAAFGAGLLLALLFGRKSR